MAEGHAKNRWANDRATRTVLILGQIFAFIVAMTIVVGGIYLTLTGRPISGLTAVFGTITAIVLAIRKGTAKPPS